jgi:penicillin-binding protein 2
MRAGITRLAFYAGSLLLGIFVFGAVGSGISARPRSHAHALVRSAHSHALLHGAHSQTLLRTAHSHALVHSVRRHPLYRSVAPAGHLRYASLRTARSSRFGLLSFVDPTIGDVTDFDDPIVREVAVEALGHSNGSVLAVDPSTGRILSIVNQKLAFSQGFEPCSTIKPVIAVAALQQGLINSDSLLPVGGRQYMGLTDALAHSNNAFFEGLGARMGFDTVRRYAQMFGLGERAGLNIAGEQAGALPSEEPARGGVARMSSFGEGIRMTPLQLASVASAVANGGTMYYLQYPKSPAEQLHFTPQIKRQLDIAPALPDVRAGMLGAVLYGTARQSYDPDEQALGKTGTCNDEGQGGRLGWYASYADQAHPKIALVVLLRGSQHSISGPRAADVAGHIYRGLRERNYFGPDSLMPDSLTPANPLDLLTTIPAVNPQ